ncbi:hypothetical protein EBR25_03500 [bacterium]|nr:hypothetical protein [bacterium]
MDIVMEPRSQAHQRNEHTFSHNNLENNDRGLALVLERFPSLEAKDVLRDETLLQDVIAILYSHNSHTIQAKALHLLDPRVASNKQALTAVAYIAESGSLLTISSSPDLRVQSLKILEKIIHPYSLLESDERTKKIALNGVLKGLDDPVGRVRKMSLHVLKTQIMKREVYEAVSRILVPDEGYDSRLRMDFDIRKMAVSVLRPAINIPYVRDVFTKALRKPEPNYEVRLPLLDSLAVHVLSPSYELRQDDGESMNLLLHRKDSTKVIQDWCQYLKIQMSRELPARYDEAFSLGSLRLRNSLETLLADQPFVRLCYTHAGHLLKSHERPPLIDNTHSWPVHHRYFLTEGEIRKYWADNAFSPQTRTALRSVMQVELEGYIEMLENGSTPNAPFLADILAFCVWTKERGFHQELTRLQKFSDELVDQPCCTEQFTIKELFRFYDQLVQDQELLKRQEKIGYALRQASLYDIRTMGNERSRSALFNEQLKVFSEAMELKVVTGAALNRLGKSMLEFYRCAPNEYFYRLSMLLNRDSQLVDLLKLGIDRAPVSETDGTFEERSCKVLDLGERVIEHVLKARLQELSEQETERKNKHLLNKIDASSRVFSIRVRGGKIPFDAFCSELKHFEDAANQHILGAPQLGALGEVLDLFYQESPTAQHFLRQLHKGRSRITPPMRSIMVLAGSDYAPKLAKVCSVKDLMKALFDTHR